jgi:hypothetical protein
VPARRQRTAQTIECAPSRRAVAHPVAGGHNFYSISLYTSPLFRCSLGPNRRTIVSGGLNSPKVDNAQKHRPAHLRKPRDARRRPALARAIGFIIAIITGMAG